jgi:hypothetical protein
MDKLADCRWPELAPRYSAALRAAVSFVFERFEPQAVIATGTIVRGGGDRASDLDVVVVHAAPFKQRLQRWFGDVPAEIFVNPLSVIRGYFDAEHRGGRPSMAHMIATGFPVFGAQACAALKEEAAGWIAKRSTLTAEEQTVARSPGRWRPP